MNKIKKISLSFSLIIITMVSKVFGALSNSVMDQLTETNQLIAIKNTTPIDTRAMMASRILRLSSMTIVPLILFIIELFVIFNKKLSERTKIIVTVILIVIAVTFYILSRIITF